MSATRSAPSDAQPGKPMPTPFAVLFALTGLLVAAMVGPFAVRIFLAACLAVTLYPLHRRVQRALGNRQGLAATVSTLLLLAVGFAPLGALAAYSASAVSEGVTYLKENIKQDHLRELADGRVPGPLKPTVGRALASVNISPEDLEGYQDKITDFLQSLTPKLAGASAAALVGLAFVLIGFFVFMQEGPKLVRHLYQLSPLADGQTETLFADFYAVASASLIGVLFTAVGQSAALSVGYYLAGMPHVFFLAVLTFLAAFVPLVGTILAWLPVAVACYLTHGAKPAAFLCVYALVASNVVDGVLKPMVMNGRMEMPGILTFLGIIGGLAVFGPVGFIAGPLCFAFFLSFLRIYERDYLAKPELAERDLEA